MTRAESFALGALLGFVLGILVAFLINPPGWVRAEVGSPHHHHHGEH